MSLRSRVFQNEAETADMHLDARQVLSLPLESGVPAPAHGLFGKGLLRLIDPLDEPLWLIVLLLGVTEFLPEIESLQPVFDHRGRRHGAALRLCEFRPRGRLNGEYGYLRRFGSARPTGETVH